MRPETLLVIGWMSCSPQAEVLGFSLWGHFVLLCGAADILASGGTDTGLGEKRLKWAWFYRWAKQTGRQWSWLLSQLFFFYSSRTVHFKQHGFKASGICFCKSICESLQTLHLGIFLAFVFFYFFIFFLFNGSKTGQKKSDDKLESHPVPLAQLRSQWPILRYYFSAFRPALTELFQPSSQIFKHSSSTLHDHHPSSPKSSVLNGIDFSCALLALTGVLWLNMSKPLKTLMKGYSWRTKLRCSVYNVIRKK